MTVPKLNPDSWGMRKYAWVYLDMWPTPLAMGLGVLRLAKLKVEGVFSHTRIKQSKAYYRRALGMLAA